MTLTYLLIASFFVSLVVVIGGAPVLSRLARLVNPARLAPDAAVGAGGAVLLLALLLDAFYLLPLPDNAGPLIAALCITLAFNGWLWLRMPADRAALWRNVIGTPLLAFLMLWLIGLPQALIFDSALIVSGWFGALLTLAFAGAIILSPVALAAVGDGVIHPPMTGRNAGHPTATDADSVGSPYFIVPTMLGIMILSLNAAFAETTGIIALDAVLHIFLPALGAIIGITFYSMRMPWRRHVLVCMGASGQMVVGIIVGWAAIQLAAAAPRPALAMASLLWMLAPPLFEVAREQIRRRVVPVLDAGLLERRLTVWLSRPSTSLTVHAMAVFMVIIGLCVFWMPEIRVWKTGVALPMAFALYLVLGGWARNRDAEPVTARKLKARNG